MTLGVRYSCNGCGLHDRAVNVPTRGAAETLIAWMDQVGEFVGADHRAVSPTCPSHTCDLKIPMTGADFVGGPTTH
jgi:hypothetical protein